MAPKVKAGPGIRRRPKSAPPTKIEIAITANAVSRTPMFRAVDFIHASRLLNSRMRRTTAAPKIASKGPRPIG